jgi:BirA family biotin operon repressor/biotin-[acetyl-CoA-carboxylase] ligase
MQTKIYKVMRDLILKELKYQDHVSGEQLAKKFNISRTAIWKHINELRKMGYEIASHSRYGYALTKNTDMLVSEEITFELDTNVIGKRILHLAEVDSTQNIADKLARDGAEEGTCVVAEKQTSGRGRMSRNWASPFKDGVYISIILRPNLKPLHIIQIPLIAGVALVKAIQKTTNLAPSIKWPNDIFLSGRKVAGILTEVNCDIDTVAYIILGMGINVNTRTTSLPKEVKGIATSLSQECGHEVSRVDFLKQLMCELEVVYSDFVANGFENIGKQWMEYNNTIGSDITVNDGQNVFEGKAVRIDEDGFLIIQTENGQTQRIISADVTLRK